MSLLKVIDGLFVGTRYGVLVMSLLGIIGSIILAVFNLAMGIGPLMVFSATLALSLSLSLFLLPEKVIRPTVSNKKRYLLGAVLAMIALVIIAITYFANGGFPAVNLIFI